MGKEILTFGNIEIEKNNYRHKTLIFLRDVDVTKEEGSRKISFGDKHEAYLSNPIVSLKQDLSGLKNIN